MIRISRQKAGKGKWLLETPWGGLTGTLVECFDGAHRLVNISGEDHPITWTRFETEILEVYATGNEGKACATDPAEEEGSVTLGMFGEVPGVSAEG